MDPESLASLLALKRALATRGPDAVFIVVASACLAVPTGDGEAPFLREFPRLNPTLAFLTLHTGGPVQLATVKTVERDSVGHITRVVERQVPVEVPDDDPPAAAPPNEVPTPLDDLGRVLANLVGGNEP